MDFIQNLIHRLEVGGGMRYVRVGLTMLTVFGLAITYNYKAFKNMASQEAMDSAQLARNIAQGKGFTTLFIRPFSMFLLTRNSQDAHGIPTPGQELDQAQIKGLHPDIANAPAYPVVLAGLMKVLPFEYLIPETGRPFWSKGGVFYRYQPDFLIAVFNQLVFLASAGLAFLLARRLFDKRVAWLSLLLLLGSDLLWKFSVSGLSTMLVLFLYVCLAWCLTLLESETREPRWGAGGLLVLAGLAGLVVGIGALARYSFGWVILPVILFIAISTGKRWLSAGLAAFLVFAATLTPWLIRNYSVSGTAFGTAGYAVIEGSYAFPEHRLERSLSPDFSQLDLMSLVKEKLIGNGGRILQTDLPKLGGTWLAGFFLVGLLVGLSDPAAQRLRYFLVSSLVILAVVQALGRTQLSDDSPDLNSENLLVLLAPFVLIYGVHLFCLLFDQIELPFRELRYPFFGLFIGLTSLPLVVTFLSHIQPFAYPPYHPPMIQQASSFAKPDELMMSDIPWAVAWYGKSQCLWLTLDARTDFFAINDDKKAIQVLFLAQLKTAAQPMTQFLLREPWWDGLLFQIIQSWPSFMTEEKWLKWPKEVRLVVPQRNAPNTAFPLQYLQNGWPNMLLLTARPLPPKSS